MIAPNENSESPLNGLILIGGKSQRMGSPKEKIRWHGKAQVYYLVDMLQDYCNDVYISCRAEQVAELVDNKETAAGCTLLSDSYTDIGPMGGILTAFEFKPEQAWLVIACDLPMLTSVAVAHLRQRRAPLRIATAFAGPPDNLPEPLFAIWEPGSYPILKQMQAQNKLSPRQALIQHHALCIDPPDVKMLINVNTPDEAQMVKEMIADKNEGR